MISYPVRIASLIFPIFNFPLPIWKEHQDDQGEILSLIVEIQLDGRVFQNYAFQAIKYFGERGSCEIHMCT